MNIHPVTANNWYRSKVNIASYKKFKRIGVDLQEMASMTNHVTDYKFYTLFSDVIIKGKVVKKVYERSRSSWWHTMYVVQATEVLKGNASLDSAKIYQMSGYVEDRPTRLFLDQLLSIGDEGIFYLNYWDSFHIEKIQEEISLGYGGNGATELNIVDDRKSFGMTLHQSIVNEYIYTEDHREGKAGKVVSRIRNVLEINDLPSFYDIDFKDK